VHSASSCVNAQIYEDIKGEGAFLRCIDLVVSSLADMLDIKFHDVFHEGP